MDMVVIVVVVVIMVMMMIVSVVVIVIVVVGHLHSPVRLGEPPNPACRRFFSFSTIYARAGPKSTTHCSGFSIHTCLWKR